MVYKNQIILIISVYFHPYQYNMNNMFNLFILINLETQHSYNSM